MSNIPVDNNHITGLIDPENIVDAGSISGDVENSNPDKKDNTNHEPVGSEKGYSNLIPISKRPLDEQREMRRKAGIKSGETRRKKKAAREYLEKLLASDIPEASVDEILGEAKILCNGDYSAYNVLWCKMLQQGLAGDTKAAVILRDTAGDKPEDKTLISADIMTDQDRAELDKMRNDLRRIGAI